MNLFATAIATATATAIATAAAVATVMATATATAAVAAVAAAQHYIYTSAAGSTLISTAALPLLCTRAQDSSCVQPWLSDRCLRPPAWSHFKLCSLGKCMVNLHAHV